jgi:hypothetical protein
LFLSRAVLLFATCLAILLPKFFLPKWLNLHGQVEPKRRLTTVPNATYSMIDATTTADKCKVESSSLVPLRYPNETQNFVES